MSVQSTCAGKVYSWNGFLPIRSYLCLGDVLSVSVSKCCYGEYSFPAIGTLLCTVLQHVVFISVSRLPASQVVCGLPVAFHWPQSFIAEDTRASFHDITNDDFVYIYYFVLVILNAMIVQISNTKDRHKCFPYTLSCLSVALVSYGELQWQFTL